MNIFVINSGSSSIKYQLFKMPNEQPVCSGLVERIGLENSVITHRLFIKDEEKVITKTVDLPDHEAGLKEVAQLLTQGETAVIKDATDIAAVGHRIVHGGRAFASTTIITAAIKDKIKSLFQLAPLHNPANYTGVEIAELIFTRAAQVAVFDTAFHQTMPEKAFRYAIPKSYYDDYNIRAYGFHGTSHKYVSEKAMEYLSNPEAKLITIHLGNGCSMAAIDKGICIDTSMGFGPLNGLIMGTRSGHIDPTIIFHLVNQYGFDVEQISTLLNKRSGMVGLTGFSDMRDINNAKEQGNAEAELALEMYAYRIQKYIGAYAAALNGIDAIIFTAGVGENDAATRLRVCTNMNFLGLQIDAEKNSLRTTGIREINTVNSAVKILIIPTNEELEIVKQCYKLLAQD